VGDLSEAVSLGLVMVVGNWGGEGEGSGVEDEDAKLGSANSVLVELGGLCCSFPACCAVSCVQWA
jgi:hypothetical protein